MEDQEENDNEKKWEHIAIRPETFEEFNSLKLKAGCRSADSFVNELLRIYTKRLLWQEHKARVVEGDKNE